METNVTANDVPALGAGRQKSQKTRDKLLAAARLLFSSKSYDAVGVRDIALEADVDPAMVSRHFGGKRGLFVAACEGAFDVVDHLPTDRADIGAFLAHAAAGVSETDGRNAFNALSFLLLSSNCPEVADVLSATFRTDFILPLAARISSGDAEGRAVAIAACVIGFATVRHQLGLGAKGVGGTTYMRDAIQRIVDG